MGSPKVEEDNIKTAIAFEMLAKAKQKIRYEKVAFIQSEYNQKIEIH